MALEVRCPVCQSSFKLGDGGHVVNTKDSNGLAYLVPEVIRNANVDTDSKGEKVVKKMKKSEERMAKLAAKGYDVSKYSFASIGGKDMLLQKDKDGDFFEVDDEIINAIWQNGYIHNAYRDGRRIMSETCKALVYDSWYTHDTGWTAHLNDMRYMYQFEMLIRPYSKRKHKPYCELKKLAKLQKTDTEFFEERKQFFTPDVISNLCYDYITWLRRYVANLPTHRCNRRAYKRILGKSRDVFVNEIEERVFEPMIDIAKKIRNETDYQRIYELMNDFVTNKFFIDLDLLKTHKKIKYTLTKCKDWIDAYKGIGGFYTAMNLVKFHDCFIKVNDIKLTGEDAVEYIRKYTAGNKYEFYKVLGLAKAIIKDNDYNFSEDMDRIYKD